MKRLTYIQLALFFLATAAARSAEPTAPPSQPASPSSVATEAPDTMTKPVIPTRDLNFEISRQLLTLPLRDPTLLEQRYVTEFAVSSPHILLSGLRRTIQVYPFHNMFHTRATALATNYLDRDFLSIVPDGRRPAKDITDTIRPPFVVVQMLQEQNPPEGNFTLVSYRVFAPTPDRAKQLVQAFLCLYDYGLSYRVQAGYLREKQAAVEHLPKLREDLEKTKLVIADCDKQLEELKAYNDVNRDALATYRTQQRVFEVDKAGIKARINACNKILERSKEIPASRVESIETVKITAEIELVGLAGKMSAITQIVQNGEKRLALNENKRSSTAVVDHLQSSDIPDCERTITVCTEQLKAWQECPIKQGKVIIRPVKWEPVGLVKVAITQIDFLRNGLQNYFLDMGAFPTKEQGLQALRVQPAGVAKDKWSGPYLDKDVPLDPWHRPYHYRFPGKHNRDVPDIWSLGPDGIDGTADDIGSWMKK